MCEWGNTVNLKVPIPANLSHTGEFRWDIKSIDSCLADIIQALNDVGIYTAGCCCGHGKDDGYLVLHDLRTFIIPVSGLPPGDYILPTEMDKRIND